jgi:hypothetical protein
MTPDEPKNGTMGPLSTDPEADIKMIDKMQGEG